MVALGRALGIYADSHADAFPFADFIIFFKLCKGIEDYMAAEVRDLLDFRLLKSRGEDVGFVPHLLPSKLCLIKPAGRGAVQIPADQRIFMEAGEGLLGQQDFAARPFLHTF